MHVHVVFDLLVGEVGGQFVQKQTIQARILLHRPTGPRTRQMTIVQTAVAPHDARIFTVFFAGDDDTFTGAVFRGDGVFAAEGERLGDELEGEAGFLVANAAYGFLLLI